MLYFLLMNKVRVRVRVRLSKTRGACEGACENFFEVRLCVRRTRKFLATQRLQSNMVKLDKKCQIWSKKGLLTYLVWFD